ncbi:MAG: SpoVA/SpoVAEb family sporulation membrane protein [Clostridia bacterium]|nr:SpoVA/SpoVAEb family sporulation membrane protein [Clostridia bacterium]
MSVFPDTWWGVVLSYLAVFAGGGLLCASAQMFIIKTKLTPARILVIFLLFGVFLQTIGVFDFLKSIFGSGITVPIVGFGAGLAEGAIKGAQTYGILGAFAGGLIQTAFGVGAAVVASYIVTLLFNSKSK